MTDLVPVAQPDDHLFRLVAAFIATRKSEHTRDAYRRDLTAWAVVAALAGRLLPADAETRTEWSVRVTSPDGEVTMSSPGIIGLLDRGIAERAAANIGGRTNVKVEAVSRFAATGPWLPAEES